MAKRGRRPLALRNGERSTKFIKRNYYIEERYGKALTVLSALTRKELSLLVNEALGDLIRKYQPKTEINLLNIETITTKRVESNIPFPKASRTAQIDKET
jgi:hypothetical protein